MGWRNADLLIDREVLTFHAVCDLDALYLWTSTHFLLWSFIAVVDEVSDKRIGSHVHVVDLDNV
jgi:hypothetical protein